MVKAKQTMRIAVYLTLLSIIAAMTSWSCKKASGQGTITMVVSGSVHGQLDPCG